MAMKGEVEKEKERIEEAASEGEREKRLRGEKRKLKRGIDKGGRVEI